MSGFIEGVGRDQTTLFPDCLDDFVAADSAVRVVDAFVDGLDLKALGFEVEAAATGRPGYQPAMLLKLFVYGYLNQLTSSRRLEREAGRNVELMWLTGKLAPDFNRTHVRWPLPPSGAASLAITCRRRSTRTTT